MIQDDREWFRMTDTLKFGKAAYGGDIQSGAFTVPVMKPSCNGNHCRIVCSKLELRQKYSPSSLLPFLHLTAWNSPMMVGVPATPTIIFLSLAKKMRVRGPSGAQMVGQKVKGFQVSDDFGKLCTVPGCFPSRLLLHERRKPGGLYS